jgi:hypothetical protein
MKEVKTKRNVRACFRLELLLQNWRQKQVLAIHYSEPFVTRHQFIEVDRMNEHFEGIILREQVHVLCITNGKKMKMLRSVMS